MFLTVGSLRLLCGGFGRDLGLHYFLLGRLDGNVCSFGGRVWNKGFLDDLPKCARQGIKHSGGWSHGSGGVKE